MRSKMTWLVVRLALAAIIALVVALPTHPANADSGGGVLPPSTNPYGHTYGEWSNLWWQWAYSMAVRPGHEQANPLFDTTGINCGTSQTGNVWFLAGIFAVNNPQSGETLDAVQPVVRDQCVVPSGKALFVPVLNTEDDDAWQQGRSEAEIRQYVTDALAGIDFQTASVDGAPIQDYLVGADNSLTTVTMPRYNLYSYYGVPVAPGTYDKMVTGGYYFMLAPLSSGQHVIHFAGHTAFGDFGLDVTYLLTVR